MEQTAQSIIMEQMGLEHLTDEEIADLAKHGNVEALEYLINKYKNFVRAKARTYFFNRCRPRRYYSRRHDWAI